MGLWLLGLMALSEPVEAGKVACDWRGEKVDPFDAERDGRYTLVTYMLMGVSFQMHLPHEGTIRTTVTFSVPGALDEPSTGAVKLALKGGGVLELPFEPAHAVPKATNGMVYTEYKMTADLPIETIKTLAESEGVTHALFPSPGPERRMEFKGDDIYEVRHVAKCIMATVK